MGPLLPTRRTWFTSLAALLGTSFVAQPLQQRKASPMEPVAALAEPAPVEPAPAKNAAVLPPQPMLLQTSPVAGFQYHEGAALWPQLRSGQALRMVREPGNRFDARAVRLDWQGHKVGYLPARDNAAVSQLLDRGERLDAVITQLRESNDPWDRIEFAVHWMPG